MDGNRLSNAFLFVLAIVAVATVMRVASTVFLPLAVAILLSFVFSPVVIFLKRLKIPRIVGIVVVILFLLALGVLVGVVLYSSTQSLLREFPVYQQRFTTLVSQVIERFDLPEDILSQLEIAPAIRGIAVSVSGNLVSFLSGFTLVVIFLMFVLLEEPFLRGKLMDAVQGRATRKVTIMMAHINQQVSRYLVVKFLISGFTAGAVFVEYILIGVDFPFIWLVLTFLFNFIPSIGSIAITIIASAFALVQFLPDWNYVILAAGAMAMTQLLIGNIMDPQLLGERLNLSPVVILLSLLLWGYIWGIMGMFIAVPITGAIKITFENIPATRPIGIMMGTGQWRRKRRKKPPRKRGASTAGGRSGGRAGAAVEDSAQPVVPPADADATSFGDESGHDTAASRHEGPRERAD